MEKATLINKPELVEEVLTGNLLTDYSRENIFEENNLRLSAVPSKRKAIKKVNVLIEGEFTIKNTERIKQHLTNLIKCFDFVSIQIRNISEIDLAALQLLKNLTTPILFNTKTISIDTELSRESSDLIARSGLQELILKK